MGKDGSFKPIRIQAVNMDNLRARLMLCIENKVLLLSLIFLHLKGQNYNEGNYIYIKTTY